MMTEKEIQEIVDGMQQNLWIHLKDSPEFQMGYNKGYFDALELVLKGG